MVVEREDWTWKDQVKEWDVLRLEVVAEETRERKNRDRPELRRGRDRGVPELWRRIFVGYICSLDSITGEVVTSKTAIWIRPFCGWYSFRLVLQLLNHILWSVWRRVGLRRISRQMRMQNDSFGKSEIRTNVNQTSFGHSTVDSL